MRRLLLAAVAFAALAAGGAALVSGVSSGATTKPRPTPLYRLVPPPRPAVSAPSFAVPRGLLRRLTPFGVPRPLAPRLVPVPFGAPRLQPAPPAQAAPCYVGSVACSLRPCTEFVSPRPSPVPSVTLAAPIPHSVCRPGLGGLQPVSAVHVTGSTLAPVVVRAPTAVLVR